ncbi:MAG: pilus assembly protein PilM [Oligoflexia bacterium]|nr:pilus assembly protein PilM [Oligoflexia bacterium]
MKILAIDIGSAQIKSVIVESKFRRLDVVLHDISSVPDTWNFSPSPEFLLSPGQLQILSEVKNRYGQGIDRIVTNLPNSIYSSRFQTFPIKDRRKVQAAVKFAIEDEIPYDAESCIITSNLFATKKKETHVLTGFAPTNLLERLIAEMESAGASPDVLLMEDAALSSQFLKAKAHPYKNVAVINLGHRKSGAYFFRNGLPVLHRNTMVGGYQITSAIAQRYNIGIAEAELAKVERGFLASNGMKLTPDQETFAETIRISLEPFFSDFQQSIMAFTSRFNEPIDMIYFCGGTSLLPGLQEYISERWGKRSGPFQINKLYPNLTIQPQKGLELLIPTATALGISQASGEHKTQVNFRSGKLHAANRGLKLNFQQFVYPATLALVIYLVAVFSVVGQMFFLRAEYDKKDALLTRTIQNVIGRVSTSYMSNLKGSPTRLQNELKKKLSEFETQVKGGSAPLSVALDTIHNMSSSISKADVMEIKVLDYQAGKINLTVESPSAPQAEKAIEALKKVSVFTNTKAGAIENAKGQRKKFTFSAGVKQSP